MNGRRITMAGLALLASAALPTVLEAQAPPEIVAGASRDAEVVFANDCAVRYDAQGRRTSSLSGCSSDELTQADIAYAAYRQEQGWDGPPVDAADGGGIPPQIIERSNDEVEVGFGDNCVVSYAAGGRRSRSVSACSDEQLAQADDVMAIHLQEKEMEDAAAEQAVDGELPEVVISNGFGRVAFPGGCTVTYNNLGRRTESTRLCGPTEVRRADEAVAAYRREQSQ